MSLEVFEDLIGDVKKEMHKLEFDALLRKCRETLGMRAYNVAEFMGITPARLKLLETGKFCSAPEKHEIKMLEKLWGIPSDVWKNKAEQFIETNVSAKKIRRRYAGK